MNDDQVPAKHGKHVLMWIAPEVVEYLPAMQSVQSPEDVLPLSDEYLPVWQFRQAKLLIEPVSGLYVPATQSRQNARR